MRKGVAAKAGKLAFFRHCGLIYPGEISGLTSSLTVFASALDFTLFGVPHDV